MWSIGHSTDQNFMPIGRLLCLEYVNIVNPEMQEWRQPPAVTLHVHA